MRQKSDIKLFGALYFEVNIWKIYRNQIWEKTVFINL